MKMDIIMFNLFSKLFDIKLQPIIWTYSKPK